MGRAKFGYAVLAVIFAFGPAAARPPGGRCGGVSGAAHGVGGAGPLAGGEGAVLSGSGRAVSGDGLHWRVG